MNSGIKVDGRTSVDILEQARKMAPHYILDWDFSEEDDSGVVLLTVFSKLLEDVVKRLDEVPEKNFIAFLDMLGMGLNPSQPARVPLTFAVSEGATEGVQILEKTQATSDATLTRPEMAFEVESGKSFLATPSILKRIISVDPGTDGIFEHERSLEQGKPVELFTDEINLQEHILYIGHDDLLTIEGQAKIELLLDSPVLDMTSILWEWEYYGEKIEIKDGEEIKTDGWHPLETKSVNINNTIPSKIPDKTPVIDIRGISSVFAKRLKNHGISTVDQLLNVTPDDLAKKLSTNVTRGENILEAVEKGLLDKSTRYSVKEFPFNANKYHIILLKNVPGEIKEFEVNNIKSRWIRGRTGKPGKTISESLIDSMMINVGPYRKGGRKPDMIFFNEIPLDAEGMSEQNPLYPFGTIPNIYSTFYLASSDAFSKKWSEISISFDITNNNENGGSGEKPSPRLSWEYWNGQGWINIPGINGLEKNFTAQGEQTITFICPGDMNKTEVNGQENFWTRIRIVDGDYGKIKFVENTDEITDTTSNKNSSETSSKTANDNTNRIVRGPWEISYEDIKAPKFENILVSYKEQGKKQGRTPGHIIKYNNLDYSEVLAVDGDLNPFTLFEEINDKAQSLYLGFERQLKSGPINIFFSLKEREYPETFHPKIVWEYCNDAKSNIWKKLEVSDETENLTKRGILSLVAPNDMSSSSNFGEKLFWIRGQVMGKEFNVRYQQVAEKNFTLQSSSIQSHLNLEPCEEIVSFESPFKQLSRYPPLLSKVKINTTWAYQVETFRDEILGSSNGTLNQQYSFSKRPVLNEEIWVNELSSLSVGERDIMLQDMPSLVKAVKDDEENTIEFWVKWERMDDFLTSGTDDRHYVLEPAMRTVYFGDGIDGRVPPIDSDNIKANYQTGGGSAGNVEAGAISSLKSSISFIDSVTNPELSDGGSDTENMNQLVMRAPQLIKNRGRAVTEEDFKWIAMEASRKVAKVNCIPNLDNKYTFNPGWVTLIVVPQGIEDKPELSVGLKELVQTHLNNRCAGALTALDRLTVNGPIYLDISLSAKLVARSMDKIPSIEARVYQDVNKFLHPLTGGYTGDGWNFGKLPCLSDFYQILEELDGVDYVENLTMEMGGAKDDQKVVITQQSDFYPQLKPYNLVCNGDHHINVTI